jgi:RNA polymerase sigma-70 factor (ECF subfamily)
MTVIDRSGGSPPSGKPDGESTATLLSLLRDGDEGARSRLLARYLPILRRWAHGRLPAVARGAHDTDDVVQVALMGALRNLDHFESRHEGALLAYLRMATLNVIRGELRRAGRVGAPQARIDVDAEAEFEPALLEAGAHLTLDSEQWLDYEAALARLPEHKREAVLLRLEFGFTYAEIAAAIGSPSEDAAHVMVKRAMLDLAKYLG